MDYFIIRDRLSHCLCEKWILAIFNQFPSLYIITYFWEPAVSFSFLDPRLFIAQGSRTTEKPAQPCCRESGGARESGCSHRLICLPGHPRLPEERQGCSDCLPEILTQSPDEDENSTTLSNSFWNKSASCL